MNNKLRVGLIGASPNGSWGTVAHLPALAGLPQFEVTAVSTAHVETARETAGKFSIPHAFSDPRSLAEHPDVDVVVVAVRVPAHEELVTMALEAGKHVYCEWPLGTDTAEAIKLRDAADKAGVMHMTGLQARHAPAIACLRDMIAEGAIGTVRGVHLVHSVPWQFGGRPSSAYLLDRASGAHYLSIPGGHSIDVICHLFGEFTSLSATLATLSTEATAHGIARPSWDQAIIGGILDGGIVAGVRLEGSSAHGTGMRMEISGSGGNLVLSTVPGGRGIQMADLELQKATGTGRFEPIAVPEYYYGVPDAIRTNPSLNVAKAYLALHDAISTGQSPTPDFSDAVIRHQTLDAIEQSHLEGRRIVLAR